MAHAVESAVTAQGREGWHVRTEGQHTLVVASREALASPSRVTLPEPEPAPGLLLADGSINWGCPCLGGMATGPCATQFRDAFSCFHYSEAEPKGSDCYEKFSVMQDCMARYPELYATDEDEAGIEAPLGQDSDLQDTDGLDSVALDNRHPTETH